MWLWLCPLKSSFGSVFGLEHCQANLSRKFYLKTQTPWVADPGLIRIDISIFTPQTCCQPPEPDLELESSLFYSGYHFRPWWCDGGGVCTHRRCSALCSPQLPPLRSPPSLFYPHDLWENEGVWKGKTTGLGREVVAFNSEWFPVIPRKARQSPKPASGGVASLSPVDTGHGDMG